MRIREIFQTPVEEDIEPVVKVGERQDDTKLAAEIGSYVVTPTIERYIDDLLEHYTDTLRLKTGEIGVWISGYFGSGKSYFAKIAALLIENPILDGYSASERFKARIVNAPRQASITASLSRLPQCDTQVLAFNINALTEGETTPTPLPKILLSQYYLAKGYGTNLVYARVIEAELDKRGKLSELHSTIERLAKKPWQELQKNLAYHSKHLYQAVCEVAPDAFSSPQEVEKALTIAQQGDLYNIQFFVQTVLDELETRQRDLGKPCRLVLVLDETGQWIGEDRDRLNHLQALIEEAAEKAQGKIWVFVTTHEDMGAVLQNARTRPADIKRLEGRFRFKFSLTTENIELVLEDRIFRKNLAGKNAVIEAYNENPGILRDLGELKNTSQKLPECSEERFTTFYPFLPYQIHLIPEVVKSLRRAGGRGEELSGSTRTLIGITQDILRKGRRTYLDQTVGEIVSFDEIYSNLSIAGDQQVEVTPDVRREMGRIERDVLGATTLTRRVAEVLYLIRDIAFIPKTIDNLARLLAEHTTDDLTSISNWVKPELDKLIKAKMVAKLGEEYEFLTGERRTFEEEVGGESGELRVPDLEKGLAKFASADVLGFPKIPFKGTEFPIKIYFDDNLVSKDGFVELRVYSPLAAFSTNVAELENQSLNSEAKQTVFVLCDRVAGFDEQLRYYLAMQAVVDRWKGDPYKSEEARKLASERESNDLKKLRGHVQKGIQEGLRQARIVFRGATRTVSARAGQKPGEAVRAEVAAFFPTLYPKYEKVTVRIINEGKAIADVLNGSKNLSADVQELKIFDKAGQIDLQCPLLDTIRVFLLARQSQNERTLGRDLLDEFVKPPYGWDGNAVRVGVAALVRAGAMRVLINKKAYTNPVDAELQNALRNSRSFNTVDLVLEETELNPDVLTDVRKILFKLTGNRKVDETPAALSEEMEKFGTEILEKATAAALWAEPAKLPLPADFQQGKDVFDKILALSNPMHRVNEIHVHQEHLKTYANAIVRVSDFVEKWRKAFTEMRDFAASITTVDYRLPKNSTSAAFLSNWKTAIADATITDSSVWKGLQNDQAAALLDWKKILNDWRNEARTLAQEAIDQLPQKLADNNLSVDELQDSLASELNQFLAALDENKEVAHIASLSDQARSLIRKLEAAIEEERLSRVPKTPTEETKPTQPVNWVPDTKNGNDPNQSSFKLIRVPEVAKKTRIKTVEEWEQVRDALDAAVRQELENGNEVELG
ncbi:BREX system P-loop protein BrxC [Coleofasciculus sp. FACHB-1120]|uniref:BREX system P-loop protein BrxC n=1 Tax=Coleofasciculus sp. FACHB-1120 TaxID=2692783 RepID=UPI001687AD3D|nr:BREX system P-loop protein BrxC [Coleofasciculus sp. FACHB-1120]MBD2741890.1 BREX system P-loop protein BrxC [Coleofasciculus sp. FACHB-1120]